MPSSSSFNGSSAVAVDIYVKDTDISANPIADVVVQALDPLDSSLVQQGVTNSAGKVELLLDGSATPGTEYEIRLWKMGLSVEGPYRILVVNDESALNKFDVEAQVLTLAGSGDVLLCRVHAKLLHQDGTPMVDTLVRFLPQADLECKTPKLFGIGDSQGMLAGDRLDRRTDAYGKFWIDLPRTGKYNVVIGGESDVIWPIVVPDAFVIRLNELIHPVPVSLAWLDPVESNAITIAVGEEIELPYEVLFSDLTKKTDNLIELITFDNQNEALFSWTFSTEAQDKVVLTGLSAGTTLLVPQIVAEAVVPVRYPAPSFSSTTGPYLSVTVTA
jgi:hypothetical protein